jgi:3-phenylpropionate/trans-cinnamate dioxygenase ferredoxin reductase component
MSIAPRGPVVIVGGGLAALSFASTLRVAGYAGEITIVGAEAERAYDRPPLSKAFLKDGDAERIRLDDSRLQDVRWRRGRRAEAIDPQAHLLHLADGTALPWETLVLATGARARTLPALAATGRPALTLRELDDARRLRELLQPGTRLLLVGAGVIGLELAATARGLGVDVTVVEAQPRVMSRSAPATLSRFVEARHRAAGVDLRLGRRIEQCLPSAVRLDDGSRVEADIIVAGIGVVANDELARACGICCDDGIFVDGRGRSSCPGVLAVGDVTRQTHPVSGVVERIETWSNAQNQAAAVAKAWLDPAAPPYADAPWYWSDQYELRIQCAGLASGDQELLRGETAAAKFTLLQLAGNRLVGAACVNNARDFGALRKLVGTRIAATPAQLAPLGAGRELPALARRAARRPHAADARQRAALWETMLAAMKLGAVVIPATAAHPGRPRRPLRPRGVRHVVAGAADAPKFAGLGQGLHPHQRRRAAPGWTEIETIKTGGRPSCRMAKRRRATRCCCTSPPAPPPSPSWCCTPPELPGRAPVDDVLARPAAGRRAPEHLLAGLGQARLELLLRAVERRRLRVHLQLQPRFDARRCWPPWSLRRHHLLCAPPTVWRMLIQEDLAPWRRCAARGDRRRRAAEPRGHRAGPQGLGPDDPRRLRPDRDHAQVGNSARPAGQARLDGHAAAGLPHRAARPRRPRGADEGEVCMRLDRAPGGADGRATRTDAEKTAEAMRDGLLPHRGRRRHATPRATSPTSAAPTTCSRPPDYRISPFELESALIEHPRWPRRRGASSPMRCAWPCPRPSLGIPALTALHAVLMDDGVAGKTVLVAGGAGAVGHYALQFASRLGAARVITTVSGEAKAVLAREAGADVILNYRTEPVAERVREITAGRGVDRVIELDMAGNAALDLELLRTGGECVGYGSSASPLSLPFPVLLAKNIALKFFMVYHLDDADRARAVATLQRMLERGG